MEQAIQTETAIDPGRYLTESEVSRLIKRSISSLQKDRSRRIGIPFFKINNSVRYLYGDVLKFLAENRIETDY